LLGVVARVDDGEPEERAEVTLAGLSLGREVAELAGTDVGFAIEVGFLEAGED